MGEAASGSVADPHEHARSGCQDGHEGQILTLGKVEASTRYASVCNAGWARHTHIKLRILEPACGTTQLACICGASAATIDISWGSILYQVALGRVAITCGGTVVGHGHALWKFANGVCGAPQTRAHGWLK